MKAKRGADYASDYYNNNNQGEKIDYEHDTVRLQKIISLIGSHNRIIDIGCYDGTVGKLLLDDNEVYGLDAATDAVKKALEKGVKAKVANLEEEWNFEDNLFDVVLAGEVIEHILDTDYFVNQIKRVLKPSGYLILSTPNVASLGRRVMLLLGKNPYFEASLGFPPEATAGHIRFFTKDLLIRFLEWHKFEVVKYTSDTVNLSSQGSISNKLLADVFPTLGKTLIVKAKNIK